jgi:hypothetical protein
LPSAAAARGAALPSFMRNEIRLRAHLSSAMHVGEQVGDHCDCHPPQHITPCQLTSHCVSTAAAPPPLPAVPLLLQRSCDYI